MLEIFSTAAEILRSPIVAFQRLSTQGGAARYFALMLVLFSVFCTVAEILSFLLIMSRAWGVLIHHSVNDTGFGGMFLG